MTKLSFNENTLYKRSTGNPIFKYNNSSEIFNYYSRISEEPSEISYNLEYEVLANQDIAFDLLHVGLLFDRQIRVNLHKNTIRHLQTHQHGNYTINKHGTFLKTENVSSADAYFIITNNDINSNLISNINNNDLYFNDVSNSFPVGLKKNNTLGNHYYTIPEIYKSIFQLNDTLTLNYSDISYQNPGRITITHNANDYQVDWLITNKTSSHIDFKDGIETINNNKLWDDASGWHFTQDRVSYHDVSNINSIFYNKAYNNTWNIAKIEKGVVYIAYSYNDISFIAGFTNIYEKESEKLTSTTDVEIMDCYWIDEPRTWFSGNGQNQNFDSDLHSQISLVDISVNNTIYTLKNNQVGLGGFASLLDLSNGNLQENNFNMVNNVANFKNSNDFYDLNTKYDITASQHHLDKMKESTYTSSLYDKLYYDHCWTRRQDNDKEGVFSVINNDATNILHNDLTDNNILNKSDNETGLKRENFSYEFPYLYFKYDENVLSDTVLRDKIVNENGENQWDNMLFHDISLSEGLIDDTTSQTDYNYGKYYYTFDLKRSYVTYCKSNAIDISSNTHLKSILDLGQEIEESEVLIKGYFYGRLHYQNDEYFVFKYKEPDTYAASASENKNNYLLYNQGTLQYQENIPLGNDRNRNLIGIKTDYHTSGYIVIHPEISDKIYIPIKIKFNNKIRILDDTLELTNYGNVSAISNGTSTFLLKIKLV